MIYRADDPAKKQQFKRLGNHWYNVMDYLRSLYNVWEMVLEHPVVLPEEPFWKAVLKSQAKPAEMRTMLEARFGFVSFEKVAHFPQEHERRLNLDHLPGDAE